MLKIMRKTCLSIFRQGWLGIPIFFIGLVSLAFSQFSEIDPTKTLSPDELSQLIGKTIKDYQDRLSELRSLAASDSFSVKEESIRRGLSQVNGGQESGRVETSLNNLSEAWKERSQNTLKDMSNVEGRLSETLKIFDDLESDFAGRMEEAMPALQVLNDNLSRTGTELDALTQLMENAASDATIGLNALIGETDQLLLGSAPLPPVALTPVTQTGKNLAAVIQASEAVPLEGDSRFSPSISSDVGQVSSGVGMGNDNTGGNDVILKLKSQLASSRSVQTEMSEDTENLQADLRKAYREIVSLQTNLQESEMMIDELEETKNSLWKTQDGRLPTAESVSKRITQLQSDLEIARSDLRQSRQSLLLEQERSNSMIRSVTSELERTRRDLDDALSAAMNSGADSGRLLMLERELSQTKRALQMARNAPGDSSSETYLNLQDELRKALGEIARMQVELGQKDDLEKQLLQLRSSLEEVGDTPSRSASPAYVNKLLIDLNAAKREVAKARAENQFERKELAETVYNLENELQAAKLELDKTKFEFEKTKEGIATREFEFATTIKKLEEDSQIAQEALRRASLGKLPAIPFVNEMEENLADSEARIEALADRFEQEQSRATEVIDGLQVELSAAVLRQKQALEQLAIREKDLTGKDKEVAQLKEEKKNLEEELEVVKVIASQLNDLNAVLEETKSTQSTHSGSTGMVISSLRDELNQAKVELLFAMDENEKLQQGSSDKIIGLEQQLEDAQAQLMLEQENLFAQSRESKDLMIELKGELDAAREEIARMKTAGLGDSVETRQAVSQLQEALGTIRILQESLNEAETVNLEVDNLRTELANAMSTQLNELQGAENEKIKLTQKVSDLETEIAILREEGVGAGVAQKQIISDLKDKLSISQAEITQLEDRVLKAEDMGLTSLVQLEDELANSKSQNLALTEQLDGLNFSKTTTVELLEKELSNAIKQLDNLENQAPSEEVEELRAENEKLLERLNENDSTGLVANLEAELSRLEKILKSKDALTGTSPSYEALAMLEDELSNSEKTISELQNELNGQAKKNAALNVDLTSAMEKLLELESRSMPSESEEVDPVKNHEDFLALEEELVASKVLIDELNLKNELEQKERNNLQEKLVSALDQLNEIESGMVTQEPSEMSTRISELQGEIKSKDRSVADLQSQLNQAIEELSNKEAELEISKAMASTPSSSDAVMPEPSEVLALQNEIDSLREMLDQLKKDSTNPAVSGSEEMKALQGQLQEAVAESIEAQIELEETKEKIAQLEKNSMPLESDDRLDAFIAQAKQTENEAQERIDELIAALRDSEILRKEMEDLLSDRAEDEKEATSVMDDSRFLDLQNELVMLQQDLMNARNLEDPKVVELEKALSTSRDDSVRLNEEFKSAMQDFGRIKDQLSILEDENRKLNDISLTQARNQAGQATAELQKQLNQSLNEISNIRMLLGERDQRIQSLTDKLVLAQSNVSGISPDNSALRAQVVRLEGLVQNSKSVENQAKLESQGLRDELASSNQRISALEENLRRAQSQARGVPSRLSDIPTPSSFSPAQIAELASLRDQNKRLQDQLKSISSVPARSELDRKIQSLNQKNLTAQIQLDQERARVQDLSNQLSDARNIKQEILERGQSANIKVDLLNDELSGARSRIDSLETALVGAREAIRVLQRGGSGLGGVQVSIPRNSSAIKERSFSGAGRNLSSNFPSESTRPSFSPVPTTRRFSSPNNPRIPLGGTRAPVSQSVPSGEATMKLKAEVQFLNNKNKPAGFTEFFLVRNSLDDILESSRLRIPQGDGIESYSEYWARAIQRGYRFPGVAASIRNALARASLFRLKTNSIGVANLDRMESGQYYVVGASTLGQVGVIWSKPITLQKGYNEIDLDLRDAVWAQ